MSTLPDSDPTPEHTRGGLRALIAYDGSKGADAAVRFTAEFMPGAVAYVVYVFSSMPASLAPLAGMGLPTELELDPSVFTRRAQEVVDQGAHLATQLGLRAQGEAIDAAGTSGVWSSIVRAAEQHLADVIVIGSRGRSGLRAALLGSVSNGVVHHSDRPVLVVPTPHHDHDHEE